MKRTLLLALLLVFVVVAAALCGGRLYLRTASPQREGTLAVPGLSAPVEVWRDSLGVPHLWAKSEQDLVFAQGFVHAQERLWQMELMRRAGEGRLSEVLGSSMLDTDRFLRVLGIARVAARDDSAADAPTRALLDAYVAGVNAFLAQRHGALPPEFLVLRYSPERWTRTQVLLVSHMMALDLSLYGSAVDFTHAVQGMDSARAAKLAPFYPEWGPTIIESTLPTPPAAALTLLDASSMTHASNAWVIGGSRTKSGKPILANDMHLLLRAPSLWQLMALHAPGIDVAGMSLPGVPFIVAGHNRAMAWGYTNAMLDDADLFMERVDPADSTRYLTPDGSQPFEYVTEQIRVKGREQPVTLRYRITRHGPVMSDVQTELAGGPVALRWASHDPAASLAAVRALNMASDWTTFRAAVAAFDDPHQNVVFADTAGHYGYAMAGRIPVRGFGSRLPPTLPVPGWTGEWDWHGYYPDEMHPAALDPPNGYVVTANNRQAAGEQGDRISADWETPFRAVRIREMVIAGSSLDAAAVHLMQLDVKDAQAERYRDRAIAAAHAAKLDDAARALQQWDLCATAESHAAAIYEVWLVRLRRVLATELFGDSTGYMPRRIEDAVLEQRALPWSDSAHTFERAAAEAMRQAVALVGDRAWGGVHEVRAEHALGSVALIERLLGLNVGEAPAGGSENTVNVSHARGTSLPLVGIYGPSQRHVVDMADVDGSGGFIIPTGESGLPFEKHYRDQFERWHEGGLWPIPLERTRAEARITQRMTLEPKH